ncbi:MAG: NAD-glutamate dehydrogenase, partial [Arenimonas sp.]
ALLGDFTKAFYARQPEDDLLLRPAAAWAAIAQSAFAFAATRPAGEAKVRVATPSRDGDGSEGGYTVVQVANDDMPFLVDSVNLVLSQRGVRANGLLHPVFPVSRDQNGRLRLIGAGTPESYIHAEIDRQGDPEAVASIEQAVCQALADVRASVADWEPMRARMLAIAEELGTRKMPATDADRSESQEFLRWAADNHFTFLGYREYVVTERDGKRMLVAVDGSGMGLMRGKDADATPRPVRGLAAADLPPGGTMSPLILTKTNARSTVHRAGYMDYIGVLQFDAAGRAVREQRFLGLYTSSAYNRRPWDIPVVRERFDQVMKSSGLAESGHSGKALKHILESLPRDELFQADSEELMRTGMGILNLQERVRPRLFLRSDRHGRFWSALVYIPRDRFSSEIRERIESLLMRELQGERLDTTIQIGESPLAQLHLLIRPKSGPRVEADVAALEVELTRIVRNWHDVLRDELVAQHGEETGLRLAARFGKAMPAGYVESVSPTQAANDVLMASSLASPADLRLSLYRSRDEALRFKLLRPGKEIALSDALPMLENL